MNRGRRVAGQERVAVVVPHHPAVGGIDDARLQHAMNPRSASSKSAVSSNGRSFRWSRCADSMMRWVASDP